MSDVIYIEKTINEMCEMQAKLDAAILKKARVLGKIQKYTTPMLKLALIDELGELTHELKSEWCWWKATQKPADRKKVLEELVDVWHFALSITNLTSNVTRDEGGIARGFRFANLFNLDILIENVIVSCGSKVNMIALTYKLGFTIDEVYEEYKRKNAINFKRIEEGY